jgi:hypothetical protein
MENVTPQSQNRLDHFEDCSIAVDALFTKALLKTGTDSFQAFLTFIERFNHLSIYNAMLVNVQRPGATAVGTTRQWQHLNRSIKVTAVPIVILQAFGPVSFLYEYADTYGEAVFDDSNNPLRAKGITSQKALEQTIIKAESFAIKVNLVENYGAALAGNACALTQTHTLNGVEVTFHYEVNINAKMDRATQYCTLAHELGQIYCGHQGNDNKGRWPNRSQLSTANKELEAEAVAWLVSERLGIKTHAEAYLSSYIGKADLSQISMYAIFEAANRVEAKVMNTKRKAR